MQRYTVYFIWKLLYMFRVHHHPSSGAQTIVSTAYGICYTVIDICRYRERFGTGLGVLWVAYDNNSTLKPAADSNNGVTNTRCCRYGC
jgi:hypothetical protein